MFSEFAKMSDAAATPSAFGIFEDFVNQPAGNLIDSSTGTYAGTIAAGWTTFSGTVTNAVASLATKANAVGSLGLSFTSVGSGTIATNAANGGWARISAVASADDSGGQLQSAGIHACTLGKVIIFKCGAQLTQATTTTIATQSDVYLGLLPVDTSIVASVPDDGVFFTKADGSTAVHAKVRVGGVDIVDDTLTAAMDTSNHTYGCSIIPTSTGYGNVDFMVDGVCVSRSVNVAIPASTVFLAASVAFQSGDTDTGTKRLDVDYIGSYQKR